MKLRVPQSRAHAIRVGGVGTTIIGGLWIAVVLTAAVFTPGVDVDALRTNCVAGVIVIALGVIVIGAAAHVENR